MKRLFVIILLFSFQNIHSQSTINSGPQSRLFSFGLFADVQYADETTSGKRNYRNSINIFENSIKELNRHDLAFSINLGDIIDRGYNNLNRPLHILHQSIAKVYNVLGNHEFSIKDRYKPEIRKRLKNKKGYLKFRKHNYIFVVLNGGDISTFNYSQSSKKYLIASKYLDDLRRKKVNNAYDWNGGIGRKQLKWLKKILAKADKKHRKVVIFCHWPLMPENGTQLWNNREVLTLIESHPSVLAWISGHHHEGGYEMQNGIHHLILKGMVEAPTNTSFGVMDVYPDRMEFNGFGNQISHLNLNR